MNTAGVPSTCTTIPPPHFSGNILPSLVQYWTTACWQVAEGSTHHKSATPCPSPAKPAIMPSRALAPPLNQST